MDQTQAGAQLEPPIIHVHVPSLSSSRFQEKGNLEVLLFTIQSKLRANNQKPYVPHDGKLISDINKVREEMIIL